MFDQNIVSPQSALVALAHINGTQFESFSKTACADLFGSEFIPLGGVHDGGADGMLMEESVYADTVKPTTFFQFTVQEDYKTKIIKTINRLRAVSREVKSLIYVTSRHVPLIDQLQEELSDKLGARISIRDADWIVANINKSSAIQAAARDFLLPVLGFMCTPGGLGESNDKTATLRAIQSISPAIAVFLGQEIERRREDTELLEATVDTLILWSLRDTDPAAGKFLTRDEILKKATDTFPSARNFMKGVVDSRLKILSSKKNPTGREIRHHKKEGKYALGHETRLLIKNESEEDETLKIEVIKTHEERAAKFLAKETPITPSVIAKVSLAAIHLVFEKQGIELTAFIGGLTQQATFAVVEHIDQAMEELKIEKARSAEIREVCLKNLRYAFYESAPVERKYYGKLARIYALLLTIQSDPRVVEYFRSMSGHFVLFVGTDIIVQALSERYLKPEDQMVTNLLRMLKESGSRLILSEATVEEINTHIVGTDQEFRNYYADVEGFISLTESRNSSKILIRTYFYGKLSPIPGTQPPAGWAAYINQVCDYSKLYTDEGINQTRQYLMLKYGMEFLDWDETRDLLDEEEVSDLAGKIKEKREESIKFRTRVGDKGDVLAKNDASMILAVYGYRRKIKENNSPNPFGYKTWWLTYENKIQSVTESIIKKNKGKFIIRPAFLLNFIALSPKLREIRQTFESVFPSIIGLQLSNRVRPDVLHGVLKKYKEYSALDPERAVVKIGELSNTLKADQEKLYRTGNTFH